MFFILDETNPETLCMTHVLVVFVFTSAQAHSSAQPFAPLTSRGSPDGNACHRTKTHAFHICVSVAIIGALQGVLSHFAPPGTCAIRVQSAFARIHSDLLSLCSAYEPVIPSLTSRLLIRAYVVLSVLGDSTFTTYKYCISIINSIRIRFEIQNICILK